MIESKVVHSGWEDLVALDDELGAMWERTQAIVSDGRLTDDLLVELTSIYNNVAYIFLYLEANVEHANYDRLLHWRAVFHENPDLDRRILGLLETMCCEDPEAEEARNAYVAQLTEKAVHPARDRAAISTSLLSANEVLAATASDQVSLLDRLGVSASPEAAPAAFYKLASNAGTVQTRGKLASAWTATRDRRRDELIGHIDAMVETRRRSSVEAGFETVLDQTLVRSRVTPGQVDGFLDQYLGSALESHRALETYICQAIGVKERPLEHFGFYMKALLRGTSPPTFPIDDCLAYIFRVAEEAFELRIEDLASDDPHLIATRVWHGSVEMGRIHFDLWDAERKTVGANHTIGLRNRTDWGKLVQRPLAHVSCRFRRNTRGTGMITFQNVHSLFHEFGHAMNHLLIRKRISNRSGLEFLPLERIEFLSMWFEKWAYHPAFTAQLSDGARGREAVELCQQVKKLEFCRTYVERAVSAALDFDVHCRTSGGLADSFRELDERYGIGRYCALGDFPLFFTWPMYVANPGANFAYLFGSAFSCDQFMPYQTKPLGQLPADPPSRTRFAGCFDFDLATDMPDHRRVFEFYDLAIAAGMDNLDGSPTR